MLTLRRILKYTPAVVMVLLVVVWIGSWLLVVGVHCGWIGFQVYQSSAVFEWGSRPYDPIWEFRRQTIEHPAGALGTFSTRWQAQITESHGRRITEFPLVFVPLPLLLTFGLPLAIGPFLSFRFRLWHYLAYTALVAVELAYYLRWQE